jgi:hypothetical protein
LIFPNYIYSGDGICCDYGDGGYNLYDGDVDDGILLATGGKFGSSETVVVEPFKEKSIAL